MKGLVTVVVSVLPANTVKCFQCYQMELDTLSGSLYFYKSSTGKYHYVSFYNELIVLDQTYCKYVSLMIKPVEPKANKEKF